MPEQETLERAREDAAEGKSPSTQAGEFVREEIDHVREGKHGARSASKIPILKPSLPSCWRASTVVPFASSVSIQPRAGRGTSRQMLRRCSANAVRKKHAICRPAWRNS